MNDQDVIRWIATIGTISICVVFVFITLEVMRRGFYKKVNPKDGERRLLCEVVTRDDRPDSFLGIVDGLFVRHPKTGAAYPLQNARIVGTTYPEPGNPLKFLGTPVGKAYFLQGSAKSVYRMDDKEITIDGHTALVRNEPDGDENVDDIVGRQIDADYLRDAKEWEQAMGEKSGQQTYGYVRDALIILMIGVVIYFAVVGYQYMEIIRAGLGI